MAKKTPIEIARDLAKRFGTSVAKTAVNMIPGVQTYNAFKTTQTPQYKKQLAKIPQPVNRSNQPLLIRMMGKAGEMGMFGPIPQLAGQLANYRPQTAMPMSHFFSGLDLTGQAEKIATQKGLPDKEKYGGYRTAGKITSGLVLGGPKAVLNSSLIGGGIGLLSKGVSNIVDKQPITNDLLSSVLSSAKYGAESSGTYALTNGIVNSLATKFPFLNALTDKGIKSTLPTAQMTLKEALKKLGQTGFKRIIKAALIETPVEGLVWGVKEQGDQKLMDSITNQTIQNFKYNMAFAGVNTLWDSRVIAPIIKKSLDQAIDAHPELQAKNLNLGLSTKALTEEEHKANVKAQESNVTKLAKEQLAINKKYLNLNPEEKVVFDKYQSKIQTDLAEIRGGKLTHDEILAKAKEVNPSTSVVSRADVLDMEARLVRAKQNMVSLDQELSSLEVNDKNLPTIKKKTQELIDIMKIVNSRGTEAGRLLESQKIKIEGQSFDSNPIRLTILKQLTDNGVEAKDFVNDAAKVNWNSAKSVTKFFRTYQPATILEKVNEYRYGNMLSNPKTQWRNVWSNLVQTLYTTPMTKRLSGEIKSLPAYYKGLFNGISNGTDEFMASVKGESMITKPDINRMPTTSDLRLRQIPGRMMEGTDRFFRALITGGLEEAGIDPSKSKAIAEYSLFRAPLDPKNKSGQGYFLSWIDKMTGKLESARKDTPLSWFIPFIRTGMNIAKQWVEYSPAGIATLPGSANKKEQLAKMLVATPAIILGAMKAANGDITWTTPSDKKEKDLFYASGKKPYSVKIGDKWVPMNTFGIFAYALALPAALNYYQEKSNTALTDSQTAKIGKAMLGMSRFFLDQTWFSGLESFVSAIGGKDDVTVPTALAFNAGQIIPMNGLLTYISNIVDPIYRKASSFKEGIQRNLPVVSKSLEPYTTPLGEPSMRNPWNAVTPYDVGTADPDYKELEDFRTQQLQFNKVNSTIKKLMEEGKYDEAEKIMDRFINSEEPSKKQSLGLVKEVSAAEAKPGELGRQLEQPINYKAERNADGTITIKYADGGESGPLNEEQYKNIKAKLVEYNQNITSGSVQGTSIPNIQPSSQKDTIQTGPTAYDDVIDAEWGEEAENAKTILSKENAKRQTGKEIDIANRIGPDGKWSDSAPIKKGEDPFTKKQIDSIDRGLFRINNITFLTWLAGLNERQMMYEAGILDKPYKNWDGLNAAEREKAWDKMLNPVLNTKFAKLLYDNWGAEQWAVVKQGLVTLKNSKKLVKR